MANTLHVTTPADDLIVFTRDFDAPIEIVWKAMSDPRLLPRWMYCPDGWKMTTCEEDVRVGGKFLWKWDGPEGGTIMSMSGTYHEVDPPRRVVRTEKMEMGCLPDDCEQLITLELAPLGTKTRMTITAKYKSKEARDGAIASGMERGMSAGYDKLDGLIPSLAA